MHYYRYYAKVQDGTYQSDIMYLIKSPTLFTMQQSEECLQFQQQYLKTVILSTTILSAELTLVTERVARSIMRRLGRPMNSIPTVTIDQMA